MPDLQPGDRVRLKADPARCGTLTRTHRTQGERILVQVQFPDGYFFHPIDALEATDVALDPLESLRRGQLARASDLRKLLTHVRLSGKLANLIYSMETTNTDFYAYQFKPVLKFLSTSARGILIADEVGLGKTIEAGLIWTELRSRFDCRRLLVLCPAVLREKWRTELRNRFGVAAQLLDSKELLDALSATSSESPQKDLAAICTTSGLRPRRGWNNPDDPAQDPGSRLARFLEDHDEELPLIDLVVIDEAHYLRNPETMTSALGSLLVNVAERTVLLSATPVHLRSRDLFQLVQLVDPDTFSDQAIFDSVLAANTPIVRARESLLQARVDTAAFIELLRAAQGNSFLRESRQLQSLIDDQAPSSDLNDPELRSQLAYRLDQINLLGDVISRTRKREVQEWRVLREAVPEKIQMNVAEAQLYNQVTELVREYAMRYAQHEGFLLVSPQRQMSSCMPAAIRAWRQRVGIRDETSDEDFGFADQEEAEPGPVVAEIIRGLGALPTFEDMREHDSKFQVLVERLLGYFAEHPNDKVVLFSYFIATLGYLRERLTEVGVSSIVLSGDSGIDKTAVLQTFSDPRGPRVLLSSEVGSEGVDLQFCRVVINYDLPWNPMRLEQRIGRLDRLGQTAPKIVIWNLMYDDTIDSRMYDRLYQRLELFTRTLGGLEAILGEHIRRLTNELLRGKLTPQDEEQRIEQTAHAIATLRKEEERLEDEAPSLVAYGDYILRQVKAARELNRWISGEDICSYVVDFLKEYFTGCQIRSVGEPANLVYEIALSNEAKNALHAFLVEKGLLGRTALASNDSAPVPCAFLNKVATPKQGRRELINQMHPLVRFVIAQLTDKTVGQAPPVAVKVKRIDLPAEIGAGTYVYLIQRWSVVGVQVKEILSFNATRLGRTKATLTEVHAEQLLVTAANRGRDWLEAASTVDLTEAAAELSNFGLVDAANRYSKFVQHISDENTDRANLQRQSLLRHFKRQLEIKERIRESHMSNGRNSLAKAIDGQIAKLRNSTERRMLVIDSGATITDRNHEVSLGLVCVED